MTASARSPFEKAKLREKRLKLLLWGEPGAGKTTLALQFPDPVVLDLEGGTDLYGESFGFEVRRTTDPDDAMAAIEWLLHNSHPFKTVVVDPITVYWDALQRKWSEVFLRRNKNSKGFKFEFYDFQPRDWMTIKAECKDFIAKLVALDMNVIVTARQKTQYADGGFMRAVGETFDGEKSLPYVFDTIVHLFRDVSGGFMARCLKDRTNKLPRGEFKPSYGVFEELFGERLARGPEHARLVTDEQKEKIRQYISQLGVPPERVAERLAHYGASSVSELTEESANKILQKLESALSTHHPKQEA